jgi:uncharacterized protein YhdP
LVSVTRQALNMLCQLEFEQGTDQFAGLTAALFDQTLEIDRIVTDQTQDISMRSGLEQRFGHSGSTAPSESDLFQYILCRLDQFGAIAYQPVTTLGQW